MSQSDFRQVDEQDLDDLVAQGLLSDAERSFLLEIKADKKISITIDQVARTVRAVIVSDQDV
jgi:hypothetical protein